MFEDISKIKDFVSTKESFLSKSELETLNNLLSKMQLNEDLYFINLKNEADLEFRKKNYIEAISLYTEYLNKRNSFIILSNRAACYHKLNMYDEAIQDCLSGIELNKSFFKFYLRLGVLYELKKETEKANEFYKLGMELNEHVEVFKKQIENIDEISEIILKE